MTPITLRNKLDEVDLKKVKKLGPVKTYFTLLKGFICTGILYLPKQVAEGGYLFSIIGLFASYVLTTICMFKLLETRAKLNGGSFTDIG